VRVLFVTNGHGEAAIADRIASELRSLVADARIDHLALVGDRPGDAMSHVGPRRPMPSGGLVAMGNTRNLLRDVRAGLLPLTWKQMNFLRGARGGYAVAVAVGDAYALAMTTFARAPTVFVGTAKSAKVARYGRFERRILARASACFVRDEATADALRRGGLQAEVANAIVDLFATPDEPDAELAVTGFAPAIALLPGSREEAYDDAAFLLDVTRELAARRAGLGGILSIAPGLDSDRFARDAQRAGWQARAQSDPRIPFVLSAGSSEIVRGWRGALGPLLARVSLVLGQAGTANEAAAAAGVPVIAFERERDRTARWYRQRQQGLLGDALAVLAGTRDDAVAGVEAILDDPARRMHMAEAGRASMGESGGARRIAQRIATMLVQS